jgi:hypothetical protein
LLVWAKNKHASELGFLKIRTWLELLATLLGKFAAEYTLPTQTICISTSLEVSIHLIVRQTVDGNIIRVFCGCAM